jgi:hypothetical protein
MRKALAAVTVTVAFGLWTGVFAYETLESEQNCKKMCEEVMGVLGDGGVDEAFEKLASYWVFGESEFDNFHLQTTKQMDLVEPRFGKAVGYQLVKEEMIGKTIMKCTYLQKFERHALRWTFLFYRPVDRWLLNTFEWDDEVAQLFE